MEFHERLALIRKANKMTQVEVAQECELAIRTYQNYESGMRTPRTDVVEKLCKVFNINNNVLFDEQECLDYLSQKKKEKSNSSQKLDYIGPILETGRATTASILAGTTLSKVLGIASIAFLTSGITMMKLIEKESQHKNSDSKKEKGINKEKKTKILLRERASIEKALRDIKLKTNPLIIRYHELEEIIQSEDATSEEYEEFLQTISLVNAYDELQNLLKDKNDLCQKALDILSSDDFSIQTFNSCYKKIIELGENEENIIYQLQELDKKNEELFNSEIENL